MRRTVETIVLLGVAGLIGRTWCVQGLLVPFQVTGGSMAETLAGPHRAVVCGDCRFGFLYGSDEAADRQWAVCPNCGYVENDPLENPRSPGDRLLIDRSAFLFRSPRRWEVVAFRAPDAPSRVYVKRVVGLPGEAIDIRDGEVYVDGRIARKNLARQRAISIPVHDARWSPQREPAVVCRWQAEAPDTAWLDGDGGFVCSERPEAAAVDWLTYGHWQRVPGAPGRTYPSPVFDQHGYNPSGLSRGEQPVPVADLLLSLRIVTLRGQGQFWLRASDGREEFRVKIEPGDNRCETFCNGQPVASPTLTAIPVVWNGVRVDLSLVDRQFLLAFDGGPAVVLPYERRPGPGPPTPRPFSIGCNGIGLEIRDVRVCRDVYYAEPLGLQNRWGQGKPVRLAMDEYFVVGDNSPVSQDSRTWPETAGVAQDLLVGKPLCVHLPLRGVSVGPWSFQVPEIARMRYIR